MEIINLKFLNSAMLNFSDSKLLDAYAIREKKIPGKILMGMAATSIFERYRKKARNKKILIFCGSGNNGGDGFALANLFFHSGHRVEIFYKSGKHSDEYIFYKELCEQVNIPIYPIEEFEEKRNNYLHENNLCIDCILGIGVQYPIQKNILELIKTINEFKNEARKCKILSIDTITGYFPGNADNFLHADYLAEIGVPKLENQFTSAFVKRRTFHPIGFPINEFLNKNPEKNAYFKLLKISLEKIKKYLQRKKDSHKFLNGVCGFIGGSDSMNGAILLSLGTFHALGGGYSKLFTPSNFTRKIALEQNPSYLARELEPGWENDIFFYKTKSIVLGPGLQLSDINIRLDFLFSSRFWVVLDAGGIELAKDYTLHEKVLLTPHKGEFSRLLDFKPKDEMETLQALSSFAKEKRAYVLLKGYVSCLASPDGKTYLFNSPNPNLGVMGTGDLLSGAIGFFLSKTEDMILSVTLALNLFRTIFKNKNYYKTAYEILDLIKRRL